MHQKLRKLLTASQKNNICYFSHTLLYIWFLVFFCVTGYEFCLHFVFILSPLCLYFVFTVSLFCLYFAFILSLFCLYLVFTVSLFCLILSLFCLILSLFCCPLKLLHYQIYLITYRCPPSLTDSLPRQVLLAQHPIANWWFSYLLHFSRYDKSKMAWDGVISKHRFCECVGRCNRVSW